MLGVGGNGSNLYTPTVPTAPPPGCSPISAVVATTTAGENFCTNAVTTCGYADPLNQTVGVPANVTPSTSGACAAYANGATISSGTVTINGCKISGTINITGGNVTITNSDITKSDITQATGGVVIGSGAGTVSLNYDTIHGSDYTSTGSLSFAVYEKVNAPAISEDHVFSYNADRILMNYSYGHTPSITNSFCWHNGDEGSEHYECVYTGPPASVSVQNDVFFNLSNQTAANYVDDNTGSCCATVDVENSLLGGGSYTLYGGGTTLANSDTYLNNRLTRALYSTGGFFGPGAYDAPSLVSSGNIWDDSGTAASLLGCEFAARLALSTFDLSISLSHYGT